jgi:hypothetical protein
MEYLCLIAEIEALKEENARLCQTITGKNVRKIHANPQKVVKSICSCLNMRGNPCKRKCLEGKDHCEKHDPSVQKPRVKPTGSKVYIEQLVPWDKTKWVSELEFWTARNEPRMI